MLAIRLWILRALTCCSAAAQRLEYRLTLSGRNDACRTLKMQWLEYGLLLSMLCSGRAFLFRAGFCLQDTGLDIGLTLNSIF